MTELIVIFMILSPFLFVMGLMVLIFSKQNRKAGLYMILASVMIVVIGFGACLASL